MGLSSGGYHGRLSSGELSGPHRRQTKTVFRRGGGGRWREVWLKGIDINSHLITNGLLGGMASQGGQKEEGKKDIWQTSSGSRQPPLDAHLPARQTSPGIPRTRWQIEYL